MRGGAHTRRDCNVESYFPCKEKGLNDKNAKHIAGSPQCSAFKAALQQAKAQPQR